MGLDMYLYRIVSVSSYAIDDSDQGGYFSKQRPVAEKIAAAIGEPISPVDGSYKVSVPAAYWRKANQIHAWFVTNLGGGVDECQEMYVEREQLQELIDLCRQVIAHPSTAPLRLPAQSGFFFGSTTYDEWYLADLKDTVKMLTSELERAPEHSYWTYRASW